MRSYSRFRTDTKIQCSIAGDTETVSLYNLSSGGCMIETGSARAEKGARVVVVLSNKAQMEGQIVWRIDHNAGVKFDHPLHQAVVETFGYQADDEDFDRDDPRDRFGIPLVAMGSSAGRILD